MPSRKEAKLQETIITTILGDRRREQRHAAGLSLYYTVIQNGIVTGGGIGSSIDLSSNGMAFLANGILPVGAVVEATLDWPTGDHALELIISGRVVRSDARLTALGHARHEIRRREVSMYAVAAS